MMSDAISHSILLGIVLSFFITKTLHSPLLFIGAIIAGVLTVVLIEIILSTNRLKKEEGACKDTSDAISAKILVKSGAGYIVTGSQIEKIPSLGSLLDFTHAIHQT